MRGKRAKTIRRLVRRTMGEPGPMLGDNRTARYFYNITTKTVDPRTGVESTSSRVVKSAAERVPAGQGETVAGIMATFTQCRHPQDPRRTYQRLKRL